jgi:RimJ/RimL family protein N-acetyltransferase
VAGALDREQLVEGFAVTRARLTLSLAAVNRDRRLPGGRLRRETACGHDDVVQIAFSRNLAELPADVDAFLAARVERHVQASLLVHARAGRVSGQEPLFAWACRDDDGISFFAMRTPPWPLLVSELNDSAAEALMKLWLSEDPAPPGVTGVPETARAVAAAWENATYGRSSCRMREAMHLLRDVVDPPHLPHGELRRATQQDRGLLIAWERAFVEEAGVIPSAAEVAEQTVDSRLSTGAQFLWYDRHPVSALAVSPQIGGTVRIGPVYTPPEHRRHGYASAAVARASRDAMDRGARQCMLFTDLANPTSNKIYAAVGFRRIGDWEELEFTP